ncbi:hypothetical protein, partial [Klebsiella pneumoniae]|uniref:hypothetical protein n=1 Tax=Klebsiella pneumoniae TaxID=573 RepID=UPI0013D832FB
MAGRFANRGFRCAFVAVDRDVKRSQTLVQFGLVDARPIKLNAHHAAGRNVRHDDTLQSPELFSEPLGKSRVHGQVDPSQ